MYRIALSLLPTDFNNRHAKYPPCFLTHFIETSGEKYTGKIGHKVTSNYIIFKEATQTQTLMIKMWFPLMGKTFIKIKHS